MPRHGCRSPLTTPVFGGEVAVGLVALHAGHQHGKVCRAALVGAPGSALSEWAARCVQLLLHGCAESSHCWSPSAGGAEETSMLWLSEPTVSATLRSAFHAPSALTCTFSCVTVWKPLAVIVTR